MGENILEVEGLVKTFDRFQLQNVSFRIPKGYIMGFVGQNGSGKTTTIKCIMDLIRYESGSIRLFGENQPGISPSIRNRIGYVSEDAYFYEELSVRWTGQFFGRFYEKWDNRLFDRLLTRFDVNPVKKVKELSRGMKVKLSLALAMAHHPELLILDEPTSGLDPVVRNEMLEVFLEIIQDENCSIFFSSHISSDIEKVADYITVIHNGRIVASEEKHKLLDEMFVIKADTRCRHPELEALMMGIKAGEFGYSAIVKDLGGFRRKWAGLFPDAEYKTERLNLDELLLRIVKGEENACFH